MNLAYVYLAIAIVSEVIATSSLKASQSFTKLTPSLLVVVGYASAFYWLSLSLEKISIGVAYALWSGIGILLLAGVGVIVYGEKLDTAAVIGFLLILSGIVVLNLFSKSVFHG
jgi:small multidrug resistance pump